MMSFKEKVSSVYYTHGLFCASHPLTVFTLTFTFVFLCCYPLSKLPFPGNAPLQHTTPTSDHVIPSDDVTQPRDNHDVTLEQRPIWYASPSAGYILQIVVKAAVSPWEKEKLYPSDAFRTSLMKAFDLVDIVNKLQVKNGDSLSDITQLCLQVPETLPERGLGTLLPQYNCLTVSPANIWHVDRHKFNTDGELIKTVYKNVHTLDKTPLLKDILFGVAWPETGMSRFYLRNRQRVISFALTLVMKRYDEKFVTSLEERLSSLYPLYKDNITSDNETKMTHVYFKARNYFFLEYTPLIVAYVVLFLYIYFSVRKIEMVKSKWGLALASVATVVASLFMSIGICTFFGLQPILLGAKIYEIFPYLVVIVGLENLLILTKSVVSTPVHMDVKYRLAEGLYKEGWGITKNLVYELLILLVGFFTFVAEIQEFCLFACVGLLSDYFLQMMFFSTVLGIDIRRMELSDLKSQTSSVVRQDSVKHPEPILHCPYLRTMGNSASRKRMERSHSFPHAGSVHEINTPSSPISNRLKLIEYIARYRIIQRLLMLATAAWIAFIFYQTGLAAHMIYVTLNASTSEQTLLKDQYVDSTNKMTSSDDVTIKEDLEAMLTHDNVAHWTKLAHAHWPTLFGFYNISLWNRYITILPPVHLSIVVTPELAVKFRHPEETKSKLDWLPPAPQAVNWLPQTDWLLRTDWLPPVPDYSPDNSTKQLLLQAKRFYPKTKREFYVTLALAVASCSIIVYLMVALYGCMCSRNYSKWRSAWSESGVKIRNPNYNDIKIFRPGPTVHLTGHNESVECVTCNGQLVVTSSLGREIRVWDGVTGQCVTIINSVTSLETIRSYREDLLDTRRIDTDFTVMEAGYQEVDSRYGYDFVPYCTRRRPRSRTVTDKPRVPLERDGRSFSADSRPEIVRSTSERQSQIWCLTCQDGLIAAGSGDGRMEIWDCISGQLKCTYSPQQTQIMALANAPSVMGEWEYSNNGITHIILIGSRVILARLNGYVDFLLLETYVAASVAGSDTQKIYMRGHIRARSGTWRREKHGFSVNDLITCSLLSSTRAHLRSITCLSCQGGRVVTASLDCSVKVYKLEDTMCMYTLHGHEAPVTALCLDEQSPLGAVTGCDKGTTLVWDLLTGACVHKLVRHEPSDRQSIVSVLSTPAYVISSQIDQQLCIWDRCRGHLLHTMYLDYLTSESLSMLTSHLLICASQAGHLHIWDITKAELVQIIQLNGEKPAYKVLTVGNSMAICDMDNDVCVVPFPSGWAKVE